MNQCVNLPNEAPAIRPAKTVKARLGITYCGQTAKRSDKSGSKEKVSALYRAMSGLWRDNVGGLACSDVVKPAQSAYIQGSAFRRLT